MNRENARGENKTTCNNNNWKMCQLFSILHKNEFFVAFVPASIMQQPSHQRKRKTDSNGYTFILFTFRSFKKENKSNKRAEEKNSMKICK